MGFTDATSAICKLDKSKYLCRDLSIKALLAPPLADAVSI
jgi:hypothetical protein